MIRKTRLNDLAPGQVARIVDMTLQNRTASRLRDMGLIEGAEVERIRTAPFGDPVEYYACGYRLALRSSEASQVHVQIVDGNVT